MENMLQLKWNHHGNEFIESLKTFRRSNLFCDVTLATNETQISCHKVVLSSCSEVFRNMLSQHSNNQVLHPFIHLLGASTRCINNLVTFMYESEIMVSQEELPELLLVANNLKVKGLSQVAETGSWNQADQMAQYDFSSDHENRADMNSNISSTSVGQIKETDLNAYEMKPVTNNGSEAGHEVKDSSPLFLRKLVEKGYDCTKCGYSTKKLRDIKRHVSNVHSDCVRVACEYCGRSFKNKNSLRTHISQNHRPKKSENGIEDDQQEIPPPVEVTPLTAVKTELDDEVDGGDQSSHNSDTLVTSEHYMKDSEKKDSLKKETETKADGMDVKGKRDRDTDEVSYYASVGERVKKGEFVLKIKKN